MTGGLAGRLRRLPQPVRFLFAGGLAAGINWLARFPLSTVMPFLPAVLGAAVIGMAVGFVLYQMLVFPGSRRPLLARLRNFVFVNALASAGVVAVAMGLVHLLLLAMAPGPAEAVAHACGIAAGAVLNFFGHRALTFGDVGRKAAISSGRKAACGPC